MPLSFYILTHNSEKYLDSILSKVSGLVDEMVIVDSGSTDGTREIASHYTERFLVRPFDNFVNQRRYAINQCTHEWIFFLDSDEIPDDDLIESLQELKKVDFNSSSGVDSYGIRRHWYVMGRNVRSIYPVSCPDTPVRLFLKSRAHFNTSFLVHETTQGFKKRAGIKRGRIDHHTFETKEAFREKLHKYTDLAALDLKKKGRRGNLFNALLHGSAAFVKWYFLKGAFRDGRVGLTIGQYAGLYTYHKYIKLSRLEHTGALPLGPP